MEGAHGPHLSVSGTAPLHVMLAAALRHFLLHSCRVQEHVTASLPATLEAVNVQSSRFLNLPPEQHRGLAVGPGPTDPRVLLYACHMVRLQLHEAWRAKPSLCLCLTMAAGGPGPGPCILRGAGGASKRPSL